MSEKSPTEKNSTEKKIWAKLAEVIDPELDLSIVEMGLIYAVGVTSADDGLSVTVRMTLTTVGCPLFDVIAADIRRRLLSLPEVCEVRIDLTFDPPWNPEMMSPQARARFGWD